MRSVSVLSCTMDAAVASKSAACTKVWLAPRCAEGDGRSAGAGVEDRDATASRLVLHRGCGHEAAVVREVEHTAAATTGRRTLEAQLAGLHLLYGQHVHEALAKFEAHALVERDTGGLGLRVRLGELARHAFAVPGLDDALALHRDAGACSLPFTISRRIARPERGCAGLVERRISAGALAPALLVSRATLAMVASTRA